VILGGGPTHPHAPPFDSLPRAFLPLIARMGPMVSVKLERMGFYPAGGGRCIVEIKPAALQPLHLPERGAIRERRAPAIIAPLPPPVPPRGLRGLQESLGWTGNPLQTDQIDAPPGPGNVVVIEIASQHVTEVFTGFGQRGVPAEAVARAAVDEARSYLAAGVPVGEHLADQLLLPMAL